jgi:hypothetical protein
MLRVCSGGQRIAVEIRVQNKHAELDSDSTGRSLARRPSVHVFGVSVW